MRSGPGLKLKPSRHAVAMAAALMLASGGAHADSSISVSANLWVGSGDWFDAANWVSGPLFNLPDPRFSWTEISPVLQTINGIPVGWLFPAGEARLAGAFTTPNFRLTAWDGVSQLRLAAGGVLSANATIGHVLSSYTPSGPLQAATVVLAGGHTTGSWNFLADSRVVVESTYSTAISGWHGTLGTLEVKAGASFVLPSGMTVQGQLLNQGQTTVSDGGMAFIGGQISNAGTLTMAGANSTTRLYLSGNTTLAGTGSTVLGGTNNHITSSGGTRLLTVGSGHTVTGSGHLGSASYGAINVVNQGVVQASGGTLASYVSSFDNSAGRVLVANGATFALGGGSLSGGQIVGSGSGVISGSGTYNNTQFSGGLQLAGGTLDGVGIADTLALRDGASASIQGTNTVTGTLAMGGANSATRLYLSGNTTLTGAGRTVLNGSNNHVASSGGTRLLTVGNGHTVTGSGHLGSGSYGAINVANQGTVQASGGTLTAYVGSFDNSAGRVLVANGATFSLSAGALSGGQIVGSGAGVVSGSGTYNNTQFSGGLQLAGGALDGVGIADTLALRDGASASIQGTNTVAGTLAMGGANSATRLYLSGNTTLAGAGRTVLNGSNNHVASSGGTRLLTVGSGHTVSGSGHLGSGSYGAINVANQGTVQASGGTLNVYVGGFDNTAGVVQVANGATFSLSGGTLSGGQIVGTGSGVIDSSGAGTYRDLALSGGLLAADGARLAGQITNSGVLTVAGINSTRRLYLADDTTLAGAGSTVLGGSNSHIASAGGVRALTIASEHTVSGTGHLGSASYGTLNIVNRGLVHATSGSLNLAVGSFDNSGGRVQVADGATLSLNGGTLSGGQIVGSGSGVIDSTGAGAYRDLALSGGLLAGDGARLAGQISNTGLLTVAGSNSTRRLYLADDTTLAGSGRTVLGGSNSHIASSGAVQTLTIASGHTVSGSGHLGSASYGAVNVVNRGLVQASGGSLTSHVGSFDNGGGRVQVADGATFLLSGGTLSGGQIVGSGSAVIDSSGTGTYRDLALSGGLQAGDGTRVAGQITNTGTFTVAGSNSTRRVYLADDTTLAGAGSTVLAGSNSHIASSGAVQTLTIASEHTVKGTGQLGSASYGLVNVVNQGHLAPGLSPGKLTVNGSLTLTDTSVLDIEAWGLARGTQYDWLEVSGSVVLDGVVNVDFGGHAVQIGDSFSFMSFGTGAASGRFDAIHADGYVLNLSYASNGVSFTVAAVSPVPEPAAWMSLLGGLLALGWKARRTAAAGVLTARGRWAR